MFSHSYYMMTIAGLFSDGRNKPQSNYPPRGIGSAASRILALLDGSHHGVLATPQQHKMLRLWIESAAAYPGTYAALGTGMIGGYAENRQVETDYDWPTTQAGAAAIERRCAACHRDERSLPRALSDERGVSFWQPNLEDRRLKFSRHIVFNLSRPPVSLILLAPLAAEAGGFAICKDAAGQPAAIFTNTDDADYRAILKMVSAGHDHLAKIKRFDMPGFQPREAYLREMKRYGILPTDLPRDNPLDPYRIDQQYWQSLWYKPVNAPEAATR
jgi:mono/diheme cytochrome c family protein